MSTPPESEHPPPAKTPEIDYGGVKINWAAVVVIILVVGGLALVAPVLALAAGATIALILIVNNSGTGRWFPGSIGDDWQGAYPPDEEQRRDY